MCKDKKRILFVVNPISGTSGKKRTLALVDKHLDKEMFDYEVRNTEYAGHAREIASQAAAEGVDVVCAIGGDGTVNEIASGLINTGTALAIIPHGSGNGLARHLHIPINAQRAINIINKCEVKAIDYGMVDKRPFFCTCGVGFDALISQKFAESGKRGMFSYMENVLQTCLKYHSQTYDIEMFGLEGKDDVQETYKAFLISCANASQYGNNFYIAPRASVCDGMMEIVLLEPFKAYEVPQMALQMCMGTLDRHTRIKSFRCRKAIIHRDGEGPMHYDGDPVMAGKDIEVEIIPQGLKCIYGGKEGVQNFGETVGNFWMEHIFPLYWKSGEFLSDTAAKTQKMAKENMEALLKLGKK